MSANFLRRSLFAFLTAASLTAPAAAQDAPAAAPEATAAVQDAPANTAECPLKQYARLDMIDLENGLAVVPVKVEDRDLYFLLDTGGFVNTISPVVVHDLNLTPQPTAQPIYGLGITMNSFVTLKNFAIGPMSGDGMQFLVQAIDIPGLSGALGPGTMRKFDVDFDFAGGKFGIYSSEHCPGKVVYWTKDAPLVIPMTVDINGHVLFSVSLDGKTMNAALDTGSVTSIMSAQAASKILGIDDATEGVRRITRNINRAPHIVLVYPFQSLAVGSAAVDKPSILIVGDEDSSHLGTDLVLGMNVLRQFHIYIAYQEGKLYLTPADAH